MHTHPFHFINHLSKKFIDPRYPLYFTTILLTINLVVMLITAQFGSQYNDFSPFAYNSSAIMSGEVWRLITYPFDYTSFVSLIIKILILFYCGALIELKIGTLFFAIFYFFISLLGSVFCQLCSFFTPHTLLLDNNIVYISLFIMYYFMKIEKKIVFQLTSQVILIALLSIFTVKFLLMRKIFLLFLLIISSLTTALFIKYHHKLLEFFNRKKINNRVSTSQSFDQPTVRPPENKLELSLIKTFKEQEPVKNNLSFNKKILSISEKIEKKNITTAHAKAPEIAQVIDPLANIKISHLFYQEGTIDIILEKIQKDGIVSLSDQERLLLAQESKKLLRREGKEI